MKRIILAGALVTAMVGSGWLAGQGASAATPHGCYVQPSNTGGSCHYKADGGSGGWTVWTQGAWKVTVKRVGHPAVVVASKAKGSPPSGQFKHNPPKGSVVTLVIASAGGGAVGS